MLFLLTSFQMYSVVVALISNMVSGGCLYVGYKVPKWIFQVVGFVNGIAFGAILQPLFSPFAKSTIDIFTK